ncbi:hypothetical protein SAMN05421854_118127 [Amycolatopsis rubida]|uniref:Uncharacterized protein n=1 Tax=Amycolatopsis rubida TaxID=112413 RepID=A0A1I6AE17_9PSEU|nr:hypothetical protein SAMN05421854_118127 [Amycolatopsis rubida]
MPGGFARRRPLRPNEIVVFGLSATVRSADRAAWLSPLADVRTGGKRTLARDNFAHSRY